MAITILPILKVWSFLSGLPGGISNQTPFLLNDIPGAIAWYLADLPSSFEFYSEILFERNDSIGVGDLFGSLFI